MDSRKEEVTRWRAGQEITFVTCYGTKPTKGRVVRRPGPYTYEVRVGQQLISVPASLITTPPSSENET